MLGASRIIDLIEQEGMVSNITNLKEQIQPCGIDLCLDSIERPSSSALIAFRNDKCIQSATVKVNAFSGAFHLSPGYYIARIKEEIKLPIDIAAMTFPRSKLTRSGVTINVSLWYKGYHGRGVIGLNVVIPIFIECGARFVQMAFFDADSDGHAYQGQFNFEGIR